MMVIMFSYPPWWLCSGIHFELWLYKFDPVLTWLMCISADLSHCNVHFVQYLQMSKNYRHDMTDTSKFCHSDSIIVNTWIFCICAELYYSHVAWDLVLYVKVVNKD